MLNQRETGTLESLYSRDEWTFTARSGQSVRLDLLNSNVAAVKFTLTGPGGVIVFENLENDSAPVTLPVDGPYVLAVNAQGLDTGSYAFALNSVDAVPLPLSTVVTESLTASGDAWLFEIETTTANPLAVQFDHAIDTDNVEVYVRQGLPPTRRILDARNDMAGADHEVYVPLAPPNTWYVLVYGQAIANPADFTIRAESGAPFVSRVTPQTLPTGGVSTATLYGVGFLPGASAALVAADGTEYPALESRHRHL